MRSTFSCCRAWRSICIRPNMYIRRILNLNNMNAFPYFCEVGRNVVVYIICVLCVYVYIAVCLHVCVCYVCVCYVCVCCVRVRVSVCAGDKVLN